MQYQNPVVKGFYPDPSVCRANGTYYMACSSFQYFPGVPLLESQDLINWTPIGYALTRNSQVMLDKVGSSGGVFAPTIRYHNRRFYLVTTNHSTGQNFYVYTDDIHAPWSEPIYVDQDGIDPSLFFEDDRAYFMSNGTDDQGKHGIVQCEIDIETGEKRSPSVCIWQGSGGRFLESPHLYRIHGTYYLMAAEGGTEYGHMITYARGASVWGPFTGYPGNPVLTNRNKAPYEIQGIGHGDLVQDPNGHWHILSLGFRQIDLWMPYHNLGREVFLTPVQFGSDGWFTAGKDGTTDASYTIEGDFVQTEKHCYTFENMDWTVDWCYLRRPVRENYTLHADYAILRGSDITLDEVDSPTFLAMRQQDFDFTLSVALQLTGTSGEAGVTCYMCEAEHYDIALRREESGQTSAILKRNIGGIKHLETSVPLAQDHATLLVQGNRFVYTYSIRCGDKIITLGSGETKYLSSEVSGGFTGVMLGLYSVGAITGTFRQFQCTYTQK